MLEWLLLSALMLLRRYVTHHYKENSVLQALLDSKDFLALTLAHPEQFDGEFSFSLGDHTQVEVWDTGVIVFEPAQNEGKDVVLSCGVHVTRPRPLNSAMA